MRNLTVFTDGAIHNHGTIGGWGSVILEGERHVATLAGNELNTTSNRMELTAPIETLEFILEEYPGEQITVDLTSDSQYVVYGASKWMAGWKLNGWHKVKNLDLWLRIDGLKQVIPVNWHWIRGHAGHKWNELCDKLATSQYEIPFDFVE